MSKNDKRSSQIGKKVVRLKQGRRVEYPSSWATVLSITPRSSCEAYSSFCLGKSPVSSAGLTAMLSQKSSDPSGRL